jgi:hypothetical protein
VPLFLTWDFFKVIINIIFLVMNVCVLNQSCGHQLLFNALDAIITMMTLKLKEEFGMTHFIANLMKDYVRKKKCDVLDGFLSFLMKYEEKTNP